VREESHLDDMRSAIRGDFERLAERRGGQELMRQPDADPDLDPENDVPEPANEPISEAEPVSALDAKPDPEPSGGMEPDPTPEPELEPEPASESGASDESVPRRSFLDRLLGR